MMNPHYFDQASFTVRCEWGARGIEALRAHSDVIIIVDVLSFSTCVDVAVGNGALVFPYHAKDEMAQYYADSLGALLAGQRQRAPGAYSLSPASLRAIPAGTRLVLPSPNGATLSRATGGIPTIAGCLRNAQVVAQTAQTIGKRISVIVAGERWRDGSLRPSIEDWIGAGAIIAHLNGARSPEAEVAYATFSSAESTLHDMLMRCGSGRELAEQGFAEDVQLAAELNTSTCVPILRENAYQRFSTAQRASIAE